MCGAVVKTGRDELGEKKERNKKKKEEERKWFSRMKEN